MIVLLAPVDLRRSSRARRRLGLAGDHRAASCSPRSALVVLLRVRAPAPGAAARPAVLPQRAVLRRDADRGHAASRRCRGFLFLNTLYLQDVRGLSALHAGLLTLPMAAVTAVFAPLSGRLVGARGPRLPLLVAGVGIAAAALSCSPGSTAHADLVLLLRATCASASASAWSTRRSPTPRCPACRASAGRRRRRGRVDQPAGRRLARRRGDRLGRSPRSDGLLARRPASHSAGWIIAGCGVLVLALGIVTTGRWARRTAARVSGPDHLGEPVTSASGS